MNTMTRKNTRCFFETVQIAILDTNNSEQWKYSQICAAYCAAMSGMAKRLDEEETNNER